MVMFSSVFFPPPIIIIIIIIIIYISRFHQCCLVFTLYFYFYKVYVWLCGCYFSCLEARIMQVFKNYAQIWSRMEQVHRTCKAPKSEPEDVISRMPDNVITNILNRLPLEEAVRTDILSRNWRYRWTMLTQLIFDKRFFEYVKGRVGSMYFDGKNISRLLLHVKGPITKFVLYIPNNIVLDVEDINHWVLFLSRKGIKEFRIINMHEIPLTLPTHIFSLLELKHLKLRNCYLHPAPADCGFPNILSLDLHRVPFGSGRCWKLITRRHLVNILKIGYHEPIEKVKLAEIAIFINLKELSLPLHMLDNIVITCSDIFALGSFLPKLEKLLLDFRRCRFLGETGTRKWVSTAFPTLKSLKIFSIDFGSGSMLSCAFEMIWGSPNLETLVIGATYKNAVAPPAFCLSEIDYHTMQQLQLQNVRLSYSRGSENEVYLIKSILACSPLLKNVDIHPNSTQMFGGENGKLWFATKLLMLHRASPAAKIMLY